MLVARLEVLGEIDARGAVRFEVDVDSTLRGMDGEPVNVTVEDFSRTGFRFSGDLELPAGTLISIGLSGAGAREAKVVWRDGQAHGCEFLMPLPREKMRNAFRGQDDLVAELEQRFREGPPPAPPVKTGLRDLIRRRFKPR
ncbi:PilZ domain-containing protein [Sphingomonas sp. G-3-2-10]|uniref:PilZ domain-containing protein n=1 Tax=Sphingomonas sp. G-3-2-10 TaxID=2728838 RepID=UPI00146D7497|nr:PilZ domain-containing protein [Sphingomonas sp. G-3-2-10]